jgi:hypothetical protein
MPLGVTALALIIGLCIPILSVWGVVLPYYTYTLFLDRADVKDGAHGSISQNISSSLLRRLS